MLHSSRLKLNPIDYPAQGQRSHVKFCFITHQDFMQPDRRETLRIPSRIILLQRPLNCNDIVC